MNRSMLIEILPFYSNLKQFSNTAAQAKTLKIRLFERTRVQLSFSFSFGRRDFVIPFLRARSAIQPPTLTHSNRSRALRQPGDEVHPEGISKQARSREQRCQ